MNDEVGGGFIPVVVDRLLSIESRFTLLNTVFCCQRSSLVREGLWSSRWYVRRGCLPAQLMAADWATERLDTPRYGRRGGVIEPVAGRLYGGPTV